jgi:hypothetical protein
MIAWYCWKIRVGMESSTLRVSVWKWLQLDIGSGRDLWYHSSTNQNETSLQSPSQSLLIAEDNVNE